jgi:hypothetical protein
MTTTKPVIWAYTYKIDPPQPPERLNAIKDLLDRESAAARTRAATWEARLVVDERISHILVLSDTPDLSSEANRRLELELKGLQAAYSLTVPMAVGDESPAVLPRRN